MSARKKFSPAVVTYVPEQGKHLTTLDRLEKEFKITFEFIVQSLPGDWGSMLRLTTTDNNCCHDGDRIPGLWIYKDSKLRVDFYSSKNNEFNHNIKTAEWYSIEISQTAINDKLLMHNYRIKLNEIIIHENVFSQARDYSQVKLFISDKFHPPMNGKIRNLKIFSGTQRKKDVLPKSTPPFSTSLPTVPLTEAPATSSSHTTSTILAVVVGVLAVISLILAIYKIIRIIKL